jgi:beta-lactamase regulating signal transducer with metallopeptidase domain
MMLAALIRGSLEGAVLVAVIWSLGKLWPRLPARVLTTLWWCAAAKFLLAIAWITPIELRILPAGTDRPPLELRRSAGALAEAEAAALRSPTSAAEGDASASQSQDLSGFVGRGLQPLPTAPRIGWSALLLGTWVGGAALALSLSARRWRTTAGILRRAEAAPHQTELLALDVARALGLRRAPPVQVSKDVATPLVAGILEPTVVLPAERFAQLSVAEQRMALCHELAHVKRADLWLGCVPALAERIFFFHPLVRLAAREYALCREAACDAAVIDTLDTSPQEYGRLLLALGVTPRRTAAVAAGAPWSLSTLKRRITMLAETSSHSPGTRAIAAAAVAAAILAIVPLRLSARLPLAAAPAPPAALAMSAQGTPNAANESKDFLDYVLFVDDNTTHTSGTRSDIRTARQYRRNGERLLWFRQGAGEYVVRDPRAIDQVIAIWQPVNELGEAMGKIGERQGGLGERQGEIGERQGRIGEEQGRLGAKQGVLGARQGVLAARQMIAFTDAGKRAIDAEYRQIDDEFRALDGQMKALDARMRALEKPMGDINVQMEALNREMEVLSGKMNEASDKAQSQMAVLIERAVASGAAVPVK